MFSKIFITICLVLFSISGFAQTLPDPIVFVQRQINTGGSVFYSAGKDMAGVGARSRFRKAAPGKLLVLETNGQIRTLVDGANPTSASLNLIDVNAPDVSYDGTKIVFAGLPSGAGGSNALANPRLWCIYVINADGSGLTKLTNSFDLVNLDYSQFNGIVNGVFNGRYDDNDPTWLPDGRIVFSSTRWPVIAQYSAASGTNLYVMNADGSNIHRITAERSGADRPVVDPTTGKIVYTRWWRNYRFPLNDELKVVDFTGSFCDCVTRDGITANRDTQMSGSIYFGDFMNRNGWQIAEINPDGTGLRMFAGDPIRGREAAEDANHGYGGGFAPDGTFYANFFPMRNMTEASGFGGIRRYRRGPGAYTSVIGVTTRDDTKHVATNSFGVQIGNYAGETAVLSDGRLLISWAVDTQQQYGLYTINADGSGRTLVYDNATTAELRAKVLRARTVPPIIPDSVSLNASLLPPLETPPYDTDGTYQFAALNVYGNAPVDWNIPSAIPVGSAARIKFFLDHQRKSYGSLGDLDFPILIKEEPITAGGKVIVDSPANVQLFEQIRGNVSGMPIPFFGPPYPGTNPANYYGLPGAAHVAGENFGRPGQVQRCIGCHAGHSMIPVPATDAEAEWSNLAPGTTGVPSALIDRKSGTSTTFTTANLTFPVSVKVRAVRLWGNGQAATVRVFSDAAATQEVGSASGVAASGGASVSFSDPIARLVRVSLTSGTSLQEIEVIASGNTSGTPPPPVACADSVDNDGDGLVDLQDPGCTDASDNDEFNEPPPPPAACADGTDNDGDGLTDYPADPGCSSSTDTDEFNAPPPPLPVCSDGLDNDGDGLTDYPTDPGCTSATDTDEFNAPPPPATLTITSLSLTKTTVRYGQFAKAGFSLSGAAPSGGQVVTFTSSDTTVAQVPSSVVVPAGISGGSIQISTNRRPPSRITRQVTITAFVNGTSKSVVLTITN